MPSFLMHQTLKSRVSWLFPGCFDRVLSPWKPKQGCHPSFARDKNSVESYTKEKASFYLSSPIPCLKRAVSSCLIDTKLFCSPFVTVLAISFAFISLEMTSGWWNASLLIICARGKCKQNEGHGRMFPVMGQRHYYYFTAMIDIFARVIFACS